MRPFMLAACWYMVPGVLWVVASDLLLGLVIHDPVFLSRVSAAKGIGFVAITGLVIYRLLARQWAAHQEIQSALLESERSFQLLFTNNPLPVWAYDRETLLFLEINDVALRKYGYSRDELLHMQVTEVHPPDEVPALLDAIRRPREVREISGVWHHRLKGGQIIEVEVQVHDLELRGRPARIVVALDVTERSRMLEHQQQNAVRARELADAAIAINLAGTVDEMLQVATQAARRIIGAHLAMTVLQPDGTGSPERTVTAASASHAPWADTRAPLVDTDLRRMVCGENRPIRLSADELRQLLVPDTHRVIEGGLPPLRGWLAAPLVARNGQNLGLIQIADRIDTSEDDGPFGVGFTEEDESILVQLAQMTSAAAENARLIQEGLVRERRFRELVEGLDAIVWEADPESLQFTYVSHQAEAILGYPLSTWLSTDDILERCFQPDDRQRVRSYFVSIGSGRPPLPCEVRARAASGDTVWLRIDGAAHADESGTVSRLRGLITNVTGEHHQAEMASRGEKLRALGQLAGGVAHDLNQSLALIAGYGELLQQAMDEPPLQRERLSEMVEVIVRAASDGGETVRRMLTFVHSQKDETSTLVDLTNVVQEVVRLTAPRWRDASQVEGRPIELTVEAEGDVIVMGSAGPLREALTNLVLNAVDALPHGGTISLVARVSHDQAIVSVSDNGVGMSDEVRQRIFEPFFTTKGERGTGLGLPTVFGIVAAYGGEISVRSEPGSGAHFQLQFPLASRSDDVLREPVEPNSSAPLPDARARRCLVVDDEPHLVRMLAMMLRREGYEALTAGSGEEALDVMAAQPVDLLITDVGMGPSMNGWELAERVKSLNPDLPIVLATGWGATIDPTAAAERGICAILSKPYRRADLTAAMSRVPWQPDGAAADSQSSVPVE